MLVLFHSAAKPSVNVRCKYVSVYKSALGNNTFIPTNAYTFTHLHISKCFIIQLQTFRSSCTPISAKHARSLRLRAVNSSTTKHSNTHTHRQLHTYIGTHTQTQLYTYIGTHMKTQLHT